ncbi:nucleoside triphosphate pyrophosphohydrolase [Proteobacteria bacterium 005FR1]|nr:nucleoside triphosphate pyrophosphohydrolase [Proteobacteria bacterium 005FR1]
MDTLLEIMARLREPETGCPWDLKQSYQSIAPSTIEEAYEVVDTIERKDYVHLKEELGDLLFQVVFYAQLGKEDGHFTFEDIAAGITDKLLRRHPHVFPDGTLESRVAPDKEFTEAEVKQQWEQIKKSERSEKGHKGTLSDVPAALPSIARAYKLQQRAGLVGFDWPDHHGVSEKLREEVGELEEAIASGDKEAMAAELGDTLFCLINLARHLKIDPDSALRACNRRFTERFEYLEGELNARGKSPQEADMDEMELLWQQAKVKLKGR